MKYELHVGNIGMVHAGDDFREAMTHYNEYVKQSRSGSGRANNERVVLFEDGEIRNEYEPLTQVDLSQL
jgi:hypothetical protein